MLFSSKHLLKAVTDMILLTAWLGFRG